MLPHEVFDAPYDELEAELHRCRGSQDAESRHLVPLIQQELAERQGMDDFMRQLDSMQLDVEPCLLEPAQQHVHTDGGGKNAGEDSVPEQQQQEQHQVPPAGAETIPAVTGTGSGYAQGTTEQLLLLSTAQQLSQSPDRLREGDSSVSGQCSTAAAQADACLANADTQGGELPSCALPGSGPSRQQEPDRRSEAPAGEAVAGDEAAESSPVSVVDAAIEAFKAERRQLKKALSAQRSGSWGFCKAERQAPKASEQAPSGRLSQQASCQSVVRRSSSKASRPAVAELSAARPDACQAVAQQQPTHPSACQQEAAAEAGLPQAPPAGRTLQPAAASSQHGAQAEPQEGMPAQAAAARSPGLQPAEASQAAASSPLPALGAACSSSEDHQQARECAALGELPCEPLELQQAPMHALQLAAAELDSRSSTAHVEHPAGVPQPASAAAASASAVSPQTLRAGSWDEELASESHSSPGSTQHLGPASCHAERPGSEVTAAALLLHEAPQAQPSAEGCGGLLEEPSSGSSAEEHLTGSCPSSTGSEAGSGSEACDSLRVGADEQAEGASHVAASQAAVQLLHAQAAAPLEWPKRAPLQHLSSLQLQLLQEGSEAGDHQEPGACAVLSHPGASRAGTPCAAAIDRGRPRLPALALLAQKLSPFIAVSSKEHQNFKSGCMEP